uniref:TRAUB domain-containing protein n=1 Tax=Mesocestoides corti TaxID=53468 RepID=A0A5K3FGH1_MESCO
MSSDMLSDGFENRSGVEQLTCETVEGSVTSHVDIDNRDSNVKSGTLASKKEKKEIDVRASKGRKIRYLKIPKAVDFMSPVVADYFTEVKRNNILQQMKLSCKYVN